MTTLMAYRTEDEVEFIKQIGHHSVAGGIRARLYILRKYLAAVDDRVDWGAVDELAVKFHLRAEIEAEASRERAAKLAVGRFGGYG